jgi:hypothetical protein
MTITRRGLLAGAGVGALWSGRPARAMAAILPGSGGVAAVGPAATSTKRPRRLDLATVTPATFVPHVGTRFRLRRPGQTALRLKLVGVRRAPADGGVTRSFSLLFRSPEPVELRQEIQVLNHPVLGRIRIFLVPLTKWKLEAVINHVR